MIVLYSIRIGESGLVFFFFFQAEDGIRDLVRSRGLGDVYKRQASEGFREQFVERGVNPQKIRVTGIPNFDDFERLKLSLIHI